MGHLAEAVNHCEDDCVTVGGWKARDKVQGDAGPGSKWDWQRLKESCRGLMGSLVLVADGASLDKVAGVLLQSGPPEALEENVSRSLGTGMTLELGGVSPLQNL